MFLVLATACLPAPQEAGIADTSVWADSEPRGDGPFDSADPGPDTADTAEDTGGSIDDVDGDGWSVTNGDCDDNDASVNPGFDLDGCDGVDNDCDGAVDEDSGDDDWEPNDETAYDLGDLHDEIAISAFLYPSMDTDIYMIWAEDGWFDSFRVSGSVVVPDDIDARVELWRYGVKDDDWTMLFELDDSGVGEAETWEYNGSSWYDDTGYYAFVVFGGGTCEAPYDLTLIGG